MGVLTLTPAWLGLLVLALPHASDPAETGPAPGIRIERALPGPESAERLARLRVWRRLYAERFESVRRSARLLFSELERSSLASLRDRCRSLRARVGEVDTRGLFPSSEVELERMLFGSLERYRAGASECLAGRYLTAYRLLLEARLGFEWVDRQIDRRLRPPIRLPGLEPRE